MELIFNEIEKCILKIKNTLVCEYKNEMLEVIDKLYVYKGIRTINLFSSIITILKYDRNIIKESLKGNFLELTESYMKSLQYVTLNNESEKIEIKLYKEVCNIIETYCE